MLTFPLVIQELADEFLDDIPLEIPLNKNSGASDDGSITVAISVEAYRKDYNNVKTAVKNKHLLGACHGVVIDFSYTYYP